MRNDRRVDRHSTAPQLDYLWWFVTVFSLLCVLTLAWRVESTLATSETTAAPQEPLLPLPLMIAQDPPRVTLGARLFHDVRLSGQDTMACATCHQISRGGADGQARSLSADGTPLARNTPSIFNVVFNFTYHWDGALPTLEAQAERVLLNPLVMRTTWPELLTKLRSDPSYVASFEAIYPDGVTPSSVLDAIAAYERSLITPNSRFDCFLRGEPEVLSPDEQRGYQLFKSYGCVACHNGLNVGGNLFQKFGIFPDVFDLTNPGAEADPGRFGVTGVARDLGVFRVPSLRNVALTAPYFHDGRAATLQDAVNTMARVQLGRRLGHDEVDAIVQFLHTLTGDHQRRSRVDTTAEGQ